MPWTPLPDAPERLPESARSLQIGAARIDRVSVSEMANNVYLLTCLSSGERLLIDAADEPDTIIALLEAGGRSPSDLPQVLTTHRHWDHHRALVDIVDRTGAATLAGEADAEGMPCTTQVLLGHQDRVRVGELSLTVIALRGHTPGSVALAVEQDGQPTVLITGDSLFPGGPGKTWAPEDFTSLMDDLESRIFALYPDDALVLPGHGAATTVGNERPRLQEWRERGW